ncbi:hypothetical protein BJ741DRAFT_609977 [Chytriomyces cf. hyalinus JEL632]|nr:hypothetical protein BJ741DRAFT_609977 [Chytriomyces cf. hyalinus JEL632]
MKALEIVHLLSFVVFCVFGQSTFSRWTPLINITKSKCCSFPNCFKRTNRLWQFPEKKALQFSSPLPQHCKILF